MSRIELIALSSTAARQLRKLKHQDIGQMNTYVCLYDERYKGAEVYPVAGWPTCRCKARWRLRQATSRARLTDEIIHSGASESITACRMESCSSVTQGKAISPIPKTTAFGIGALYQLQSQFGFVLSIALKGSFSSWLPQIHPRQTFPGSPSRQRPIV